MSTRTPKSAQTKQRLLDAAEHLFAQQSFDSVAVRAIARQAGVDAALINHYFGSKEGLFQAMVERIIKPQAVTRSLANTPRDQWGQQLVRYADAMWSSASGKAVIAVFRRGIAGDPQLLHGTAMTLILGRLEELVTGPDAKLRASLVTSQMAGVAVARHIMALEPLASLSIDELADLVGPTIQRYLTEELSEIDMG